MNKFVLMIFAVLCLAPFAAVAEEQQSWQQDTHYDLITPAIRTSNPDKIEVTEFFWYGCSHCYNLEPMVEQWQKSLGEDVVLRASPAVWNQPMELHAQAFYTAEVLGVLDKMHMVLFQAMNVDGKRLSSEAEVAALFTANGVSEQEFNKAFNSFGVGSQVRQANARARAAKITGTPEIMVAGKYRISTRKAGSQANMFKIADFLIAKERAAKAS